MVKEKRGTHTERVDDVYLSVTSLIAAGLFGIVSLRISNLPPEARKMFVEHGPEIVTWGFRVAAGFSLLNAGHRIIKIAKGYLAK